MLSQKLGTGVVSSFHLDGAVLMALLLDLEFDFLMTNRPNLCLHKGVIVISLTILTLTVGNWLLVNSIHMKVEKRWVKLKGLEASFCGWLKSRLFTFLENVGNLLQNL